MQATRPAHRIETTIQEDGTLTLDQLPFRAGQSVEVIILPHPAPAERGNPYPLRGVRIRYDRPFEPVAGEDWNSTQ